MHQNANAMQSATAWLSQRDVVKMTGYERERATTTTTVTATRPTRASVSSRLRKSSPPSSCLAARTICGTSTALSRPPATRL